MEARGPLTTKAVGDYVVATKEWWIDPLDPEDKGANGISGVGDYVGVGRVAIGQRVRQGPTGVGATVVPVMSGGSMTAAWAGIVGVVALTLGGPLLWALSNRGKGGK